MTPTAIGSPGGIRQRGACASSRHELLSKGFFSAPHTPATPARLPANGPAPATRQPGAVIRPPPPPPEPPPTWPFASTTRSSAV